MSHLVRILGSSQGKSAIRNNIVLHLPMLRGIAVTNKDGKIVHPYECMDRPEASQVVLILDCPSVEHVESLAMELKRHVLSKNDDEVDAVRCVIHLSPMSVFQAEVYQDKVIFALDEVSERRNYVIDHVVANSGACSGKPVFVSSEKIQSTLNVVAPKIFQNSKDSPVGQTLLNSMNESRGQRAADSAILRSGQQPGTTKSDIICAEPMLSYTLLPAQRRGLSRKWQI